MFKVIDYGVEGGTLSSNTVDARLICMLIYLIYVIRCGFMEWWFCSSLVGFMEWGFCSSLVREKVWTPFLEKGACYGVSL